MSAQGREEAPKPPPSNTNTSTVLLHNSQPTPNPFCKVKPGSPTHIYTNTQRHTEAHTAQATVNSFYTEAMLQTADVEMCQFRVGHC